MDRDGAGVSPSEGYEGRDAGGVYDVERALESGQIGNASAWVWHEITDALCPVIGRGGVDALYRRSLHLTSRTYPWLGGTEGGGQTPMDLAGLEAVLAAQEAANAASGGDALVQTFCDLLAAVIGPSLTARLLRRIDSRFLCAKVAVKARPSAPGRGFGSADSPTGAQQYA
jgi:hypothetical protein